ncbi:uncharacterized protein LOC129752492 [Uranotaenia lowii]|uniref:uncharacterized protein LOC129752492 n=1 Tax=Uranotaenia lowii TaxID=190385 RepID=UPI002479F33B|nr:uncharacterized protein LOC129752492 [Uranotaenia lowii]
MIFRNMSSKSFDVTKPAVEGPVTRNRLSSRKYCEPRRKRCMSILFCVICFSLLIGWVMNDIFYKYGAENVHDSDANSTDDEVYYEDAETNDTTLERIGASNRKYWVSSSCYIEPYCVITCSNMDIEKMNAGVRDYTTGSHPCTIIHLIIVNLLTDQNALFRGWLDQDVEVTVDKLEIRDSRIGVIPAESFDTGVLFGTTVLTLDKLDVSVLEANVFIGLTQLKELNLKYLPLTTIHAEVLAPIKFNLNTLMVEHSLFSVSPRPFTGTSTMDRLENVSLRFNSFGNVLEDDAFRMAPKLKSLYLSDSRIAYLSKRMIDSISNTIEQIHLENNHLNFVEDAALDSLNKGVRIYLKGNPFHCDCSLLYLKSKLASDPEMFDEVVCSQPPEHADQRVLEANFCASTTPDGSTSTTEITEEPTSEPTAEPTSEPTSEPTTESTTDTTTEATSTSTTQTTKPTDKPPTSPPPSPPTSPPTTEHTTEPCYMEPSDSTPGTTTTTSKPTTTTIKPEYLYTLQCLSTVFPVESNVASYQGSRLTIIRRSKTFTIAEAQEGAIEIIFDKHYSDATIVWFHETTNSDSLFNLAIEEAARCVDIYGRNIRITNLQPGRNYMFCVFYRHEASISPFDCLPHRLLPAYGQRTWMVENDKIKIISIMVSSVLVAVMTGVVFTYCFIKSFSSHQTSCRRIVSDVAITRTATNRSYMTPVASAPVRTFSKHKRSVSDTSLESCRSYVSAVAPATQYQYIAWKLENRSRPGLDNYPCEPPPPPLPPHPSSKRFKHSKPAVVSMHQHQIYNEPDMSCMDEPPPPMPSSCHRCHAMHGCYHQDI